MILALATIFGTTASASAHAVLLATEPVDGAVLGSPPGELVLRFNEPVAPVFVRVIGPDGQAVPTPDTVRAVDTELRLTLPPDLPQGGYIVSYRVISADSHPVGGSIAFAIGASSTPEAPLQDAALAREKWWKTAKVLLRFMQNLALMLAAGGALFQLLVLRAGDRIPGLRAMIAGGAATAAVVAIIGIGVQGGLLAVVPISALLDPAIWRLGASSTVGTAALVLVPALMVVALSSMMSSRRLGQTVAALGALAAVGSLVLTGHAAASGWMTQLLLALHVIAVAYWLGALWPLHIILHTRSADEAVILVRRFSAIAVPAVGLLIVAGIAMALTHVAEPAELVESTYGRLLLLKIAFVGVLVSFAIVNRWRLTPALAHGSGQAPIALARNVRLELALAGAILFSTAVLAHTAPPHAAAPHDHHSHHEHVHGTAPPGYAIVTVSRGRTALIEVSPAQVGANAVTLWLLDTEGRPLEPIEVTLSFALPIAGIEPLGRTPTADGKGRYTLPRIDLPLHGRWRVRIDALISEFEKVIFTTELPVQ